MINLKSKYYQIQNKSKIPNPNFWNFEIWIYLVVLVLFEIWIYPKNFSHLYAQEQFVYDSQGKRNPFIPLLTADGRLLKLEQEGPVGSLLLEGIIYDQHGLSYAIVNGEVVKVGDAIGDYQVLKVEKNRVIFIKEGETTEIELKEEEP